MRKNRDRRQASGQPAGQAKGTPAPAPGKGGPKIVVKTGLETRKTSFDYKGKVESVEHLENNGNTMVSLRVLLETGELHSVLEYAVQFHGGEYEIGDMAHAVVGQTVEYTIELVEKEFDRSKWRVTHFAILSAPFDKKRAKQPWEQ